MRPGPVPAGQRTTAPGAPVAAAQAAAQAATAAAVKAAPIPFGTGPAGDFFRELVFVTPELETVGSTAPFGVPTTLEGYPTGGECGDEPDALGPVYVDRFVAWSPGGTKIAVFDHSGDVITALAVSEGFFHLDTRHLSHFYLTVYGGQRPILLSSGLRDDNSVLTCDLSNPDISGEDGEAELQNDLVHIRRTRFIYRGSLFERLAGLCNDLHLLAEEYDPHGQRQLGNFPQAFSHLALINSAHVLAGSAGGAWQVTNRSPPGPAARIGR